MASTKSIPPFLRKLVSVTESCPPEIGAWNSEGTHFVVTSSQFADVLREHFQGSLQTFVRQLHFYSFQKKDEGSIWTFHHEFFQRGKPELLSKIERKASIKKKNNNKEEMDMEGSPHGTPGATTMQQDTSNHSVEQRLRVLESALGQQTYLKELVEAQQSQIRKMEEEMNRLKEELLPLTAAQSMLNLAPQKSHQEGASKLKSLNEAQNNKDVAANGKDDVIPPRPNKVARMTSLDSVPMDFPWEDTSSVGSVNMREVMKELQNDFFADFDGSFIRNIPTTPVASVLGANDDDMSTVNNSNAAGSAAAGTTTDASSKITTSCQGKEDGECDMEIPAGFPLHPGVTLPLIKEAFDVLSQVCCPSGKLRGQAGSCLLDMCNRLPNPNTLPSVEVDPVCRELLGVLRENVKQEATDLQLMRASRQVYEVYYHNMIKKLQEKQGGMMCPTQRQQPQAATPSDSNAASPSSSSSNNKS